MSIQSKMIRQAVDYLIIGTGCLLVALGLDLFLIPNKITAGGVSGVATILHYSAGLPVGLTMLAINAVLFLMAFRVLGREFGLRSVVATVLLALMVDGVTLVLPHLGFNAQLLTKGITQNLLLATIFGDIIAGTGMALVFMRNASTGGTDIPARILNKFTEIPMGRSLMIVDTLVTVGAGFVFGAEMAMYAIIAIYVGTQTIDILVQGLKQGKQFVIVSERWQAIRDDVLNDLGRGATVIAAIGAYTGSERPVLLTVIRRREFPRLKTIIRRHDPHAFVMVSDVSEILGEGFTRLV